MRFGAEKRTPEPATPNHEKTPLSRNAVRGALPRRGESYDLRGPASRTIQSRVRLQLCWSREEKSPVRMRTAVQPALCRQKDATTEGRPKEDFFAAGFFSKERGTQPDIQSGTRPMGREPIGMPDDRNRRSAAPENGPTSPPELRMSRATMRKKEPAAFCCGLPM